MHHISRKNGAKQHLRVHPNNLQCTENHYASFGVALFVVASQMKNSARNFSAMGPGAMENVTNKHKKQKEAYHKLKPYVVRGKNWNTKEDKGTVIHDGSVWRSF